MTAVVRRVFLAPRGGWVRLLPVRSVLDPLPQPVPGGRDAGAASVEAGRQKCVCPSRQEFALLCSLQAQRWHIQGPLQQGS